MIYQLVARGTPNLKGRTICWTYSGDLADYLCDIMERESPNVKVEVQLVLEIPALASPSRPVDQSGPSSDHAFLEGTTARQGGPGERG